MLDYTLAPLSKKGEKKDILGNKTQKNPKGNWPAYTAVPPL